VGKGSTMSIYLPLSQDHTSIKSQVFSDTVDIKRGKGETLLLVDDEPGFVDAHCQALKLLVYLTPTASTGLEDVRIFAENPTGIDVVLTDVVMQEMGGVEAAEHMPRIRPDVHILFTSGYELGRDRNPLLDRREIVLTKPFSIIELSHALRQRLDS